MVTGGVGEPNHLDTTEVLVEGGISWSKVKTGALPAAMRALRVITVGNEIFSTGTSFLQNIQSIDTYTTHTLCRWFHL